MADLSDVAAFHDACARDLRRALEHPELYPMPAEELLAFLAWRRREVAVAEHDAAVARAKALALVREVAPRWRARLAHSDDVRVRALALENLE